MMTKSIMSDLYKKNDLLFYLRTHPEWYKIIYRHPEIYREFKRVAKEELKQTFKHKIDRFKNQIQLLSLINEYMRQNL